MSYLSHRRIEESKYLLGNTGHSLAQISELMGFSSPSYFSQCFRKAEGISPNEYRRQVRGRVSALLRPSGADPVNHQEHTNNEEDFCHETHHRSPAPAGCRCF